MQITREFYIPHGATKVAHKPTGAVAYLYATRHGELAAMVFAPKATKPAWRYRFRSPASREQRVASFFEAIGRRDAAARARRAERSRPHSLQVGHILYTSWGYEQTNREFFEVTAIVGSTMVELREIAALREATGWECGRATPRAGDYVGEPIRRRVDAARKAVRIDSVRCAWVWDGKPLNWTSYA